MKRSVDLEVSNCGSSETANTKAELSRPSLTTSRKILSSSYDLYEKNSCIIFKERKLHQGQTIYDF